MASSIQSIRLDKLIAHPDNPNRMSEINFNKLFRNIKRSGRYEPLLVRPHPDRTEYFQIINGHHRYEVLAQLGYETADAIVWDVDDKQTDVLLATLNRLGGTDRLDKKLKLLKRLTRTSQSAELAKLLPQTAKQIERLVSLKRLDKPARVNAESFATSLVFFVNDAQKQTIEEAIELALEHKDGGTRAVKRAAAVTAISRHLLERAAAMSEIAKFFINDTNSNKKTISGACSNG
jgi:ParB/RepB/Spo0J family partition protein